ncbi:MAG: hypothetical protein JNJ88_17475 [Planctomycetes bacterium]|nr:hypothetical protein [Planctomycetota bacterium]
MTYPDDGGGNRGYVKYAYNAPSQLLWTEDQATNVLGDAYDGFDGEAARRVITRGSGSDGAMMPVLTLSDAKQFCDHYKRLIGLCGSNALCLAEVLGRIAEIGNRSLLLLSPSITA